MALLLCLIGIVLFDGLSETPAWTGVLNLVSESQTLRPTLLALRAEGVDPQRPALRLAVGGSGPSPSRPGASRGCSAHV